MYMTSLEFGNWLLAEMKKKNMRQADLARTLGIATSHVANIVYGKRGISPDLATKISIVFQVPEQEVFRRAGIATARPTRSLFLEFMEEVGSQLSEDEQEDIMDNVKAKLARKSRSKESA